MIYFIKQLVGSVLMPLPLAALIGLLAAVSYWSRRQRLARALIVVAVAIAYLGALVPVGNGLLAPLERSYAPLRIDAQSVPVAAIVVLGSGFSRHGAEPVTAGFDDDGLGRVVEGVRLWRMMPAAMLVLSGGAPHGQTPSARGYAELAIDLGVPPASLVIRESALDTASEAADLARFMSTRPFVLVTSAYHMPRAMLLMRRAGLHPIPAPTGQRSGRFVSWSGAVLPTSGGLRRTEYALHEYLGLAALLF